MTTRKGLHERPFSSGPWTVDTSRSDPVVVDADGNVVAAYVAAYSEGPIAIDLHDARLMSAGPEMLEALEAIMEDEYGVDIEYDPESPLGKAQAAIKKARGQAADR